MNKLRENKGDFTIKGAIILLSVAMLLVYDRKYNPGDYHHDSNNHNDSSLDVLKKQCETHIYVFAVLV